MNFRARGVVQRRNRIELEGEGVFLQRLWEAVSHNAKVAVPEVRRGIVGAESEGELKLAFRPFKVPVVTERNMGEDGVSFGKLRVELKSMLSSIPSLGLRFAR